MANNQAPFGFRYVRRLDGAQPNYKVTTRYIAFNNANKIAKGDPVKMLSTGFIDIATPGAQIAGIFIGCKYYDPSQNRTVWLPSWSAPTTLTNPSGIFSLYYGNNAANVEAEIIDDPWAVFEVQAGGSSTAIAIGNVQQNINFGGQGSPNTANISQAFVDQTSIATTAGLPFRIVGLSQKIGNDNSSGFNTVEVALNNSDYKTLSGV